MATRCKFVCTGVTKYLGWGSTPPPFFYKAEFSVVTGGRGEPENDEFFASTPSGGMLLSTIRHDHFEPGKSYYVDFSEA